MWTYRTPIKRHRATSAAPNDPHPQASPGIHTVRTSHRHPHGRSYRWLCALYFAGMLFGSLLFPRLNGPAGLFLEYESEAVLQLYSESAGVLFSSTFLAAFVQMTLVLILGLCVFGGPIILILLFGKGAWCGSFNAYLYSIHGFGAIPITAGLVIPPQMLTDGLFILLCGYALRCSSGLFRNTLGPQPAILRVQSSHLLRMYLILTLSDLAACAATVLLAQTLGELLL